VLRKCVNRDFVLFLIKISKLIYESLTKGADFVFDESLYFVMEIQRIYFDSPDKRKNFLILGTSS